MKILSFSLVALILAIGVLHAADSENPVETKLREALRNTMLQLRDAQGQIATLQAAQIENDQKMKDLTAKLDTITKQAISDRSTSANMVAELNTKAAEQNTVIQALEVANMKWKKAYTEVTTIAQKKENERSILAEKVIKLDRQVADQQIRNIKMYQTGEEILDRYAKFGLGEAITAREPFVGTTRVKFQTLMQDYQDKLVDSRIQPQ